MTLLAVFFSHNKLANNAFSHGYEKAHHHMCLAIKRDVIYH
jgi:hypothetical protein